MANNKKYNIITSIEEDAPHSEICWCTISFLTPQKIEQTKFLDIKGFKVHNGYITGEWANDDAKIIKQKNDKHDVYLSKIGKIYGWDDATKTDAIEYDDEKLNELEKTRRENIDKMKLVGEQFKNEYKTLHANANVERSEALRKRMQKKLYDKGLISQKEYELMQEENKPVKEIKEIAQSLESLESEIEEAFKTDYLDENEPSGLKYGCMSIYSPKRIGGLKTLLFKIRGLFQTPEELMKRVKKLEKLYPNDRIYKFEIGKWTPYSDNDHIEPITQLKQLNYCMKCYIENMDKEKEDFEKRKKNLQSQTEQESKVTKAKNRRQRKKEKLEAEKNVAVPAEPAVPSVPVEQAAPITSENTTISIGNEKDDAAIQKIFDYLDEPELHNKFAADKNSIQTMAVDIK